MPNIEDFKYYSYSFFLITTKYENGENWFSIEIPVYSNY